MNKLALMIATVLFIGLTACNEDSIDGGSQLSDETSSFENEQNAEDGLDDVSDVFNTMYSLETFEGGRTLQSSIDTLPPDTAYVCAVITHNRDLNEIVIDFGDGCVGLDGALRSGKIIMTYTGFYLNPGAVLTKTFDNYFVNGHQLEGFFTLTNISETEQSFPKFNLVLEGGQFTWNDGRVATRESDFVWEWINANNPLFDEYHKDGTASGVNRNGVAYEVEIISTLVRKRNCWTGLPVQGIKEVVRDGKPNYTVDYGDGSCDAQVTITREDGESATVRNFQRFRRRNG